MNFGLVGTSAISSTLSLLSKAIVDDLGLGVNVSPCITVDKDLCGDDWCGLGSSVVVGVVCTSESTEIGVCTMSVLASIYGHI